MPIHFEAYTADGVHRGDVSADARLGDLLEAVTEVQVLGGHLAPLDGRPPIRGPEAGATVPVDDLMIVVAPPDTTLPGHPAWHDIILTAGPYRISGLMPTMPGFDPARALARPTGTFVLLAQVRVSLAARPGAGEVEHPLAWVNRYDVEGVESDIELGFFFPGAASTVTHGFRVGEVAGAVGGA